jgi:predicted dehydrogenase
MTTPIRIALVGYGYWGPNLARNISSLDETELVAVCDVSPDARQRAFKHHRDARMLANLSEVLDDPAVDAVVVAVPAEAHHAVALEALEAGKHVLVEKPLARTVNQCNELIAAASAQGLTLMAGHTFVFNEAVRLVKGYLDAGELGDPYYVSMRRTNLGIVRSDANALWSLGPHDISILQYWLGSDVVSVSATGVAHLQDGIEDVVFASMEFAGGVLGHVHCSWLEPNKVRDATIVGSRKMVVYDDTAPEAKIRLYDKGIDRREVERGERESRIGRYENFAQFQMMVRAGDVILPRVKFEEPLAREMRHFSECIREQEEPIAGGRQARDVVAVLEAAQRSLEAGGAPQSLEVRVDV